jgi:hypothetical protein
VARLVARIRRRWPLRSVPAVEIEEAVVSQVRDHRADMGGGEE